MTTAIPSQARMLRVVHVISGLGLGGAERMLERLCVEQLRQGLAEPVIVSLSTVGTLGERMRRQGIRVEALGMTGPANLWRITRQLIALLREIQPDLVQSWLYHADLIAGIAMRLGRIGAVFGWNIRCTSPGANRMTRALVRVNARLGRRLPDFIVCCGDEARRFHERLGYPADRMKVLPNGFDVAHFEPRGRPQHDGGCRFVSIGRDDVLKDFPTLIRAAAIAIEAQPEARFAIYGTRVPDNPEYRRLIGALGLDGRFELIGEIEDVREALATADVYCSSSSHEGFPNVIGEAMLMGLPCVATDAGDSAAIVGDGGLIVPPRDPQALAEAMLAMARLGSEGRSRRGALARSRIVENYEIGHVAQLYAEFYRSLVSAPIASAAPASRHA